MSHIEDPQNSTPPSDVSKGHVAKVLMVVWQLQHIWCHKILCCGTLVNGHWLTRKRRNCLIKSLFLLSLHTKSIVVTSYNYGWTTDVSWTILTMSLLPFWALYVVVTLLSMQGQKDLRFHQKYINLLFRRWTYGFGTTWRWVINGKIFIFGWTIPLNNINLEWVKNLMEMY